LRYPSCVAFAFICLVWEGRSAARLAHTPNHRQHALTRPAWKEGNAPTTRACRMSLPKGLLVVGCTCSVGLLLLGLFVAVRGIERRSKQGCMDAQRRRSSVSITHCLSLTQRHTQTYVPTPTHPHTPQQTRRGRRRRPSRRPLWARSQAKPEAKGAPLLAFEQRQTRFQATSHGLHPVETMVVTPKLRGAFTVRPLCPRFPVSVPSIQTLNPPSLPPSLPPSPR